VVLCRLQLDLDAATLREGEGLLVGRRAVAGGAECNWWQHEEEEEEEEEEPGGVSISKTATSLWKRVGSPTCFESRSLVSK
jgi:hypothetical protein